MKEETKKRFNELTTKMAKTYGVDTVSESFNVTPTKAQKLQDAIIEKSAFLKKINVMPVSELQGENVLAGVHTPLASRTKTTDDNPRKPKNVLSLTAKGYQLSATESDVAIAYTTLDSWAKFPDMLKRFYGYVNERIANDRELCGWYGESAAEATDLATHSELQDVNIGWYQYMRNHLPSNIMTEGETAGEVRFGTGGDYVCLDALISDLVGAIPTYLRAGLVAFIGDELISYEKQRLYALHGSQPSEKNQLLASLSSFGGVSGWETPSNFPARGVVITRHDNLSLYHQDSSWRRSVKNEDHYNRIAIYNSRNEGYTVETPEKFVAVDFKHVKLPDGEGGWG